MEVREPGPRFEVHGDLGSFVKWGLDLQEEAIRAGAGPATGLGERPPTATAP
jgi:scyllo-inositol 2-dehydrogenase (NADP+)